MENERITENEINILDMLFVVRKNLVKIIISAVVVAVIFLAYTLTMVTPLYRSTTQLLVKGISQEAMTLYPDSNSRIMLMNNSIEVLGGTEVMIDVIDELELELTPEQLQAMVSISSPADTQVIKISVLCSQPELAKDIAAAFGEITHSVLAENVGVSALSIIQEAKTPVSPVSPNPVKNTILGGFLGAVLAAGFYLVMWFINSRINTSADTERVLGLTVFSSIPLVANVATENASQKKEKGAKSKKAEGGRE